MTAQVFLIPPPDMDAAFFTVGVAPLLSAHPVAALLVRRGERDPRSYEAILRTIIPMVQAEGCAALVEDDPALALRCDADGVHVTGGLDAVRAALDAVKPDLIVGAAGFDGRHSAMQVGETGVDYLMFGPLSGALDAADFELARWWAETFEVPGVLSDPGAKPGAVDACGCEFIAVGESLFAGSGAAGAAGAFLASVIEALGNAA